MSLDWTQATPERAALSEALPIRNVCDEARLITLMEENGETAADIVDYSANAWRAADFSVGVVLTKRHVYTLLARFWEGDDGAYLTRIFVGVRG